MSGGGVAPAIGPILVTGGAGQLATALRAHGGARVVSVGRPELDFDRAETIDAVFRRTAPSIVVNAAAYTAVGAAETDRDAAFRANRDAPARLAALAADHGIPLIHVSTDYVYDGRKGTPYVETDDTAPTGVYGRSKLEGEQAALDRNPRTVVLRTAWVFSPTGRNFVRTMLNAQARGVPRRVGADQHGSPTAADDLAVAILALVARGIGPADRGIYHAVNGGFATWHGFAEAIFAAAARHGRPETAVVPIRTADWPTQAVRPADTRLDNGKLARAFGIAMPDWRPSLVRTVDALLATNG